MCFLSSCSQGSSASIPDITCEDVREFLNQTLEKHNNTKEILEEAIQSYKDAQNRIEELEEEIRGARIGLAFRNTALTALEMQVKFFYEQILPHIVGRMREAIEGAFRAGGTILELRRRIISVQDNMLDKMVNQQVGSDDDVVDAIELAEEPVDAVEIEEAEEAEEEEEIEEVDEKIIA